MFVHTVLFWLKPEAPAGEAERIARSCRELLGKIPGVRQVHAGLPAMTPREVVDNSYATGLCVLLEDAAAHDVYQAHELHLEFIKRHKQWWQRVQVYDFK